MSTASVKAASRPMRVLTLAEKIDATIDQLYKLRSTADNERRTHRQTEDMIDGLYEAGQKLCKLARG